MIVDLKNARVLIVGASGGIGSATADASVEAFFAASATFDHVMVAAARTKTGSVGTLAGTVNLSAPVMVLGAV
ncbi:NAD(P)-dependent dehydrogenase (short-subunit alcohol dehydrogenase family) [Azospirillum lipoferum]|uniref:Short chain dehydrogenase n=1 Tax=Azospirillum lipoferum TaxID=193 RepID=A0A5A9GQ97_AZOLI|nr:MULTISPECIES: hypothetical protein [Azospirillum]KAA0595952.1 hypothetical protein FZ942_12070 [Azospirillum lipoferum]MCP1610844.1 NAD(P)-dependent dehydrogenase (short-subunit alcohol dehydrogenase family) [Azospirillum lipoferum]MDW5534006.1 hypothetical protein [Azospirillum sp. NL1]